MKLESAVLDKIMVLVNFVVSKVHSKILASLILLLCGYLIARAVAIIMRKYVLKLTLHTKTEADDLILKRVEKPVFYIVLVAIFEIAIIPLELTSAYANKILSSVEILLITYVVIAVFDVIIEMWAKNYATKTNSSIDQAVLPLIHKFSKVFLFIVGLIFVFDFWGVEISPLLASLGIAGIAVAFALQNTLGNIFGGVSLILDKTVKVGDRLRLDDGTIVTVTDVGLRSTKMRNFNNEIVIFPNGKLADSRIENLALPDPSARVVIDFGVEYGSDPEKVKKVVLNAITPLDTLKKADSQPDVYFMELGDSALKFRTIFWVKSYTEQFTAKVEATEKIYNALNKARIGIPFPTRTVYLKKGR